MTTTKASSKTNADYTIQVDQLATFNANGDPVITRLKNWIGNDDGTVNQLPDSWALSWRDSAGATTVTPLQVTDLDDIDEAKTKAQEHLRAVGFEPQGAKLEQFGNEPESTGW